MNSSRQPTQRI